MDEMYPRINQLANEQVYTFMKENEISPLSYHFSDFFDECLDRYSIKLMEYSNLRTCKSLPQTLNKNQKNNLVVTDLYIILFYSSSNSLSRTILRI